MASEGQDKVYRRVCIPVDGSEDSHRAFEFYLDNIMKPTDIVIITNAQELLSTTCGQPPYAGLAFYEEFTHMIERSDDASRDLLKYYGERLKLLKLKFKLIKEAGRPGDIICLNAKEEKASMIIMGCRGLTTTKRTFIGSVSDYVVHNAHLAVLVVPPPLGKKDNPRNDLDHIQNSCVPHHHHSKEKNLHQEQSNTSPSKTDSNNDLKKKDHEIITDV